MWNCPSGLDNRDGKAPVSLLQLANLYHNNRSAVNFTENHACSLSHNCQMFDDTSMTLALQFDFAGEGSQG